MRDVEGFSACHIAWERQQAPLAFDPFQEAWEPGQWRNDRCLAGTFMDVLPQNSSGEVDVGTQQSR
jgi:hypothetical protein